MAVNDPIGDMIARIRNAAMRKRSKVSTPASVLRGRVLEVLQSEGYIRGYALVEKPGTFAEYEIELKYFDGEPVIVEIARVSKPGRRVYSSVRISSPSRTVLVSPSFRHPRVSCPTTRPAIITWAAKFSAASTRRGEGKEKCHGSAKKRSPFLPASP